MAQQLEWWHYLVLILCVPLGILVFLGIPAFVFGGFWNTGGTKMGYLWWVIIKLIGIGIAAGGPYLMYQAGR